MELFTNGIGLSAVVFFPLISAFVITLIPKAQEQLIKRFALASSLITFVLSAILLFQFDFSWGHDEANSRTAAPQRISLYLRLRRQRTFRSCFSLHLT